MLTYDLDPTAKSPLYEQLYSNIKKDISEGKIKRGDRLPSKRLMAKHMQISIITVENAYAQLNSEGYIYSVEKKGYFVADISKTVYAAKRKKIPKAERIFEKPEYLADFVSNRIDLNGFPITVWSRIVREVLSEDSGRDILKSVPLEGIEKLRNAIADHLYHFRGLDVEKDEIVIGSGTEYLYNLLIQLLGNDRIYATEDPGYPKPYLIYKSNKAVCKHVPMDGQGIDLEKLRESEADIVHITPSHHFPTGIVMPVARRYELLRWAYEKKERYVIEDDYDSEFRMYGRPIPSLKSIDDIGKVIYINTFSKTISPSIRIAYMVLPSDLMERFKNELYFYTNTVASMEQNVLALFISRGYFEKHINRMRNIYRLKRDALINYIRSSAASSKYEIMESDSGLHFLLKIETEIPDELVIARAEEKNIKVSAVSQYCLNKNLLMSSDRLKHLYIINYPGVDTKKAIEALKILFEITE
ncbi:MAG: PLP-dependent aminotransferase family protein [Clostridia bacterium]